MAMAFCSKVIIASKVGLNQNQVNKFGPNEWYPYLYMLLADGPFDGILNWVKDKIPKVIDWFTGQTGRREVDHVMGTSGTSALDKAESIVENSIKPTMGAP